MRAKALEIRWHETNPIFSADFHHTPPTQHKKPSHPYAKLSKEMDNEEEVERDRKDREKQWRLATCGGDRNVRLWLVTPRPPPTVAPLTLPVPDATGTPSSSKPNPQSSTSTSSSSASKPFASNENPDPKVEYLATLSQHTGVVNCVRFCPHGETLASAGDDGNILLWVPGEGSRKIGETDEDRAYERESWKIKSMIRSFSGKEIYDLAWSPSGLQILAGSVDHSATVYDVSTGQALKRIMEHTNYVQGVAWDPRDEFIATQSSDRSMHVYSIANNSSGFSADAVGKNSRMELQRRASSTSVNLEHSSSQSRGRTTEKDKAKETKDGEDVFLPPPRLPNRARSTSRASDSDRSETSSTSTATTSRPQGGEAETAMEPPASIPAHHHHSGSSRPGHSRRSSSSTTTSQSPALGPVSSRPLRSPSPAPLPAVMLDLSTTSTPTASRNASSSSSSLETIKLYSDANSTPFFRRLSWSTDGSLLLTPAGMFEDPFSLPLLNTSSSSASATKKGKKKEEINSNVNTGTNVGAGESKPTVYIYTRSNVSKPPVANLMGHRTTSIAIRFCPILWELRRDSSSDGSNAPGGSGEDGDEPLKIELTEECKDVPLPGSSTSTSTSTTTGSSNLPPPRKSLFDLPYRMVYAVATLDSVYLYDTQQESPICMFGNLHYAPFTDLTWSPDGQSLILSSQDGYCSIVAFSPGELGTPYSGPAAHPQGSTLTNVVTPSVAGQSDAGASAKSSGERKLEDMFSGAQASTSSSSSSTTTPAVSTPSTSQTFSIVPEKRPASPTGGGGASGTLARPNQLQVKKKKKVALTHVGSMGGDGGGAEEKKE
ncbi:Cac2p [Sporobolomyces salmoneus]|uniref:Cac2p n=1 Tax=Sporobolomyces salmoneus TaxID=183962 RepID=UPI00316B412D